MKPTRFNVPTAAQRQEWWGPPLDRDFFHRDPAIVARELLGKGLVHQIDETWVGGWIVETEAYLGEDDPASHSHRGPRAGNQSMFDEAGTLYVYPIHAKHCLNIVTERKGVGSAILIRALQPMWGVEVMTQRRGVADDRRITSGPGMICQALGVDRTSDGIDLLYSDRWALSAGVDVRQAAVATTRIGISQAKTLRLRFFVDGNRYVSGRARDHTRPRREVLAPLAPEEAR